MRLFEFGTVYRYERSGVIHGLARVRGITQDDAHIFCAHEQLGGELASLLAFVLRLLRTFGLTQFEAELATRPETFVGTPKEWDQAEAALKEALDALGLDYLVADALSAAGLRAEVDTSGGRMQAKVRAAQLAKVPYTLVVGDHDEQAGAVSGRLLDGSERRAVPLADFVQHLAATVAAKDPASLPPGSRPLGP